MEHFKNQCDYDHGTNDEVRAIPLGGHGNIIACKRHYEVEMRFRRERIREGVPFDLPAWESLSKYVGV